MGGINGGTAFLWREVGAQKAARMEFFAAEAANSTYKTCGADLLDLTKAFELVRHRRLVEAAKEHDYPLAILRLSIAAYRITRAIGVLVPHFGNLEYHCRVWVRFHRAPTPADVPRAQAHQPPRHQD